MAMSGGASLEHTESESETIKKSDQRKEGESNTEYTASTSGSTNTTVNSGSTNTSQTVNSGATNTSTVGPRETSSTTNTAEQVNTSQLLLTQEAVDYMVKGILEGNSGLAGTLSGGAQSGVYNSATTALLGNDLVARTAGEVAARAAVTKSVIGATSSSTVGKDSGFTTTEILGGSTSSNTQTIGGSSIVETIGGQTATGKSGTKAIEDIILNENVKSESSSTTGKVEAKVGWIVCTELHRQGKMRSRIYVSGLKEFQSYDSATHRGYYLWAIPTLKHIRKYPEGLLSKFMELTLNARAEQIAAEKGVHGTHRSILGFVTKQLRWVCWALGHTVARSQKLVEA